MSSAAESKDYYDLSLEDVRLIGHALSLRAAQQPTFLGKLAFKKARKGLLKEAVVQHSQNYPSLDPEKNKYSMLLYPGVRQMIGVALDSVAELVPVHNDAAESVFQINFASGPGRPGLAVGLLEALSSSEDMLGDIQRLRGQLNLLGE